MSNASSTWETAANWSPDGVPLAADSAVLNDVTSGTRTVTISSGSPQTIANLTMTQTTVGAVNKLSVEENLTISNSTDPLTITATAGAASVVVDIAAGKTLQAHRTNGSTSNFGGTLNLLGSGSVFQQSSTGAMAANFSGPVNAAAGSSLKSIGTSTSIALSGASTFGTGSNILLQYTGLSGSAAFTNGGTLVMNGATLAYDWATSTSSGIGTSTRNYTNTGTWTLSNNSSVTLISSTGFGQTGGGFTTLTNNNNSGTINLESGSSMASRTLFNTGTLNLGSSTGGVSDAAVTLGALVNSLNFDLTNGATSAGATSVGTINIKGDAIFGSLSSSITSAAPATLNNGTASSAGSVLNVGDGVVPVLFSISNNNVALNNFAGNTVDVKAGATLRLTSVAVSTNTGNASFTNDGVLLHAGAIQFRSNANAGTRTFSTGTTGSHKISGTGAVVESLSNSAGGTVPAISFSNSGLFGGATSSDKLTYINSSGNAAHDILTIAKTGGQFAPGNGSNGSGISSIGTLVFENVNLTFSGSSTLTFDIGGTVGSGLFDSVSLTGDGAVLTLGSSGILDIRLVNGFSPAGGTYMLANATSVGGTFSQLLLNGVDAGGAYSVGYGTNSISITFAAIPEPSSAALMVGTGVLGLVACRRRSRIGQA